MNQSHMLPSCNFLSPIMILVNTLYKWLQMIGVWAMCVWEQMGRPKNVNLVELGPGRGTLMVDLLRVSKYGQFLYNMFHPWSNVLNKCYIFNFSQNIAIQHYNSSFIQGASKFKQFTDSLHVHLVECSPTLKKIQHRNLKCVDEDVISSGKEKIISQLAGIPISWHASFEQVPSGGKTIVFDFVILVIFGS